MPGFRFYRKISLFLFFTLLFAGKVCAFELFQFSVAPKYALQWGQMNGNVLYSNRNKLSELNWQLDSVNMLGFNATMGWEMIFLEANCMWGFPKTSGRMFDSDWQNKSNYGMQTNYSDSLNKVDYLGNLEIRLGLKIKTWDFLFIKPYGSITYQRYEFTAEGGDFWYGDKSSTGLRYDVSYNDPEAKTGNFDSYGKVINYKREAFNYCLGSKFDFSFLEIFTVSLDLGLSVYTAVNSVDNHILRKINFLDKMQGFFNTFYIGSELDVKIWKGLSAGTAFRFSYQKQLEGKDYQKTSGSDTYKVDSSVFAAASGYYYNLEFFVRYSF